MQICLKFCDIFFSRFWRVNLGYVCLCVCVRYHLCPHPSSSLGGSLASATSGCGECAVSRTFYQRLHACASQCALVRAQFKVTSSLKPARLARRWCRHALGRHADGGRGGGVDGGGALSFPLPSNMTGYQYLITAGTNHEINFEKVALAQWHV